MRDYTGLIESERRKVEILDKLRYILNMSYENDVDIETTFKKVKQIMAEAKDL